MSLRECGRALTGSRAVGMSRVDCGKCPRVAVMAFDPGPTR
jgi:hypothetical protein